MENPQTIAARIKDSFRAYLAYGTMAAVSFLFQKFIPLPIALTILALAATGVFTLIAMCFLWWIRSDILLLEETLNKKS